MNWCRKAPLRLSARIFAFPTHNNYLNTQADNSLYNYMQPELIVAGAGAGDPELITLKAYRLLQEVPVVLYDNLVNKSLLDHTKPYCENIYVGKLPYGEYTPQEQINELIKEKAFSKGRVLRLKGGDPFIFGRGFEEILFARQHGIKTTFIP